MNGVSTACFISPLPFPEAVASTRVGRVEGELIAFPSHDQLEESDLDIIVSGTEKAVTMIEGFAREVPEDVMLEAIKFAHDVIKDVIDLQKELAAKVNIEQMEFEPPADNGLLGQLSDKYRDEFTTVLQIAGKQERGDARSELKERAMTEMIPDPDADDAFSSGDFGTAWHDLEEVVIREMILNGQRSDGRGFNDVRDIECHIDVLPRVHGSAVFQRGETQSLITVTLGTGRDEQRVDGLMDEYSKKVHAGLQLPTLQCWRMPPDSGSRSTGNWSWSSGGTKYQTRPA
jgi:polyribonucleotide nucleotidyltransferase